MNIDEAKVRELALHARAYDAKEDVTDPSGDPESGEDVDLMRSTRGDPGRQEMADIIDGLDEEAQAELVAFYWIGRGDYEGGDFATVVAEARGRKTGSTSGYLLGAPLLGDHLEAGLDAVLDADTADDA
ncbi:MAG: DUF3775 domain-containing protein [Maricaulaceae bacterium]|jgi:hypothetical protein